MARRSKERPDTKAELIDSAWELFASQGYEGTTVNAIIDRVGLSKGSFYHYFASKEEVLDAVVDRMTCQIVEATKAADDMSLPAIDRLNRFMEASRRWKLENVFLIMDVVRIIYRDENVIIRHKMHVRTVELAGPVLAGVIRQGVDEGVFDTFDPDETAVLLLHVTNAIGEMQAKTLQKLDTEPQNLGRIQGYMDMYMGVLERILGVPEGSIELVDEHLLGDFAEAASKGH